MQALFISLRRKVRRAVSEAWGSAHSSVLRAPRLLSPGISAQCRRRRHTGNATRPGRLCFWEKTLTKQPSLRRVSPLQLDPAHTKRGNLPRGTTLASRGLFGFDFKESDCGSVCVCGGVLRTVLRNEALGKERNGDRENGICKGASPFFPSQCF